MALLIDALTASCCFALSLKLKMMAMSARNSDSQRSCSSISLSLLLISSYTKSRLMFDEEAGGVEFIFEHPH